MSFRPQTARRVTAAAVALFAAALAGAAQDGKGEKIAYATLDFKAMKFQLWVMSLEGGDPKALTDGKEMAFEAALSPDGKQVAFVVMVGKDKPSGDLHVMNLDGSGRKQLTKHDADRMTVGPSWSADGKRIAFSVVSNAPQKGQPTGRMYVIGADGEGLQSLGEADGLMPALSPDGKRVMFTQFEGGRADAPRLKVMDIGGKEAREVVKGKAMMGRWSPDGKRIVYMGEGGPAQADVFVMNADGSDAKPLTKTEQDTEFAPQWTADGKRIVFTRMSNRPDGQRFGAAVYVMNADGSGEKRLTKEGEVAFAGGGAALFLVGRSVKKEFKEVDPNVKNP